MVAVNTMAALSDAKTVGKEPQEIHLVLVSKDPERVYPALTLALGGVAMGNKVSIYATMSGLEAVKKHQKPSEGITMPGLPPIEKYVKDAIQAGVRVCACAPSQQMLKEMGVTEENVIEGVHLEDVIGFLKNALPAAQRGGVVLFI
jgi:predicted peroxiredoxin